MEKFKENLRGLLVFGGTILAAFVLLPLTTNAATLFLTPSSGPYSVGNNFSVTVKVNTEGTPINAGEGTIIFNPNELTIVSLSKSGSIFNMWVQEPDFSNVLGNINFGGIILNPGYRGTSGTVLTLNFKAKAASNALLSFSSGAVLANDGLGTNVLSAMSGGAYLLKTSSTVPQTTPEIPALSMPAIKSPTHLDQSKWYSNNNPEFSWTLPKEVNDVSYLLNQKSDSDPDSIPDGLRNSIKFTDKDDGIWYFHIKFKESGKWGPTAHYKLQIDTIPPPILKITRDINQNNPTNPQVSIVFKGVDNLSGVDFYQMKIGDENWLRIDRSLEGQPYKLPMAQILGFRDISIKTTDFAGNSIITKFDANLIEEVFIKTPVKLGEPLELKGKAKPNSKLIISLLMAEAAKQMLGAQISSLAEKSGEYTKQIEKTVDKNGDWQIELYDLLPVKYILAVSLQDYSMASSKTPAGTVASAGWFQMGDISKRTLLAGFIVVLVGLLIPLFMFLKVGIRKLWTKVDQEQEPAIQEQEPVVTENETENELSKKP